MAGDLGVFAEEGKSGGAEPAAKAGLPMTNRICVENWALAHNRMAAPRKPSTAGRRRHCNCVTPRNNPLTAFVCHTLSNLRFDKAGAWLDWSNRDTNVPNELRFCSACSGKAQ
ncbi:MAG: hypothetical protein H6887_01315 [Hoeflea sp.]|nr:hypothetical protein [Hoeflea sp.]